MKGWLLQGDKDNYRAILVALQSVSGVPFAVSEKEREFIPTRLFCDCHPEAAAFAAEEPALSGVEGT